MTCIIGLSDGKKVWMGGDSASVGGYSISRSKQPKVFRNGDFLIGYTTSFRMGQLLQHSLVIPKRCSEKDLFAYMVTDFVDAVRNCLKTGGFARKDNEVEQGGQFLIGHAGRLFMIFGDYQVNECVGEYTACGCGFDIALGAMYAQVGVTSKRRIEKALEAAEEHSCGVRGPFHIEAMG